MTETNATATLGFGNLHVITWSQSRIPPDLMGRVMSVPEPAPA